jgi:hypothetical protein
MTQNALVHLSKPKMWKDRNPSSTSNGGKQELLKEHEI